MKHSILILIGCALAISPLGAEDDTKPEKKAKPEQKSARAAGKGAPGKGGPRDGSFLKEIDKDGDKAISKEEAGERWERMSQLDKDKDGKVTMKELAAGRGGPRPDGKGGPGKGAPGEMFKRADKNSDGKISKGEVPEEAWARLSKLDKDGDNAVSGEEARAGAPGGPGKGGPGKGGEFLKRADKNKDGNISKDEVPEQAWERLGKLDKNKDGSVSKEEMAAGMAAMRGGDKGKGKGKGGQEGGPGAVFGRFDKNKDDKLSESEVPAEMWSKLRKADNDADGLVSKKELGKVYAGREGGGDKPPKKKPEPKKDEA